MEELEQNQLKWVTSQRKEYNMTELERLMLGVVTEPTGDLTPSVMLGVVPEPSNRMRVSVSSGGELFGSQGADPFGASQYMKTLEADEGFIDVARKLQKGTDPITGDPIFEEFPTGGFGDYGPQVKVGQVYTREEDLARFQQRVQDRMQGIQETFPDFGKLPFNVRDSMVSSNYRGSLPGSPKTIDLINAGQFLQAGDEFLDNDEYRDAEGNTSKSGIRGRMERLSNALKGIAQ